MEQYSYYCSVNLLIMNGDKILLLKRKNTGFEDGNWGLVAGKMDGKETVKLAAIREAKEEANIRIDHEHIEVIGVLHREGKDHEWIDFYLLATQWHGEIHNNEPEKCEELKWFSVKELPKNVISYIRKVIDLPKNNVWFESYFNNNDIQKII